MLLGRFGFQRRGYSLVCAFPGTSLGLRVWYLVSLKHKSVPSPTTAAARLSEGPSRPMNSVGPVLPSPQLRLNDPPAPCRLRTWHLRLTSTPTTPQLTSKSTANLTAPSATRGTCKRFSQGSITRSPYTFILFLADIVLQKHVPSRRTEYDGCIAVPTLPFSPSRGASAVAIISREGHYAFAASGFGQQRR
ncbi:hypothetical protein HYPSUDRAFT_575953 [Hypholoma sublateritium FD-334 SS-4]|uniref:Uncharacterized protein n=1 Tax=Hypholoma sublateritium (strain FD-334 SS-4) TaxID=945553 RepID=A0A0D2N234_HYPSF|nr:hypothetical protein HYPSUDRAFT_575953 [Hypholoma sublateritium FD-334 SS-4]